MSDDQDECEWVSVSSGTGLPGLSLTKAIKRLCVCVCVCIVSQTQRTTTNDLPTKCGAIVLWLNHGNRRNVLRQEVRNIEI